jgi:hypothetical protein
VFSNGCFGDGKQRRDKNTVEQRARLSNLFMVTLLHSMFNLNGSAVVFAWENGNGEF